MKKNEYIVTRENKLMDFLIETFPDMSRTKIKEILAHSVRVDGKKVSQFDYKLEAGMCVTITRENAVERNRLHGLEIVYEDRYLLVVNKMSGLLTNSRDPRDQTVISELNRRFEARQDRYRAHVVHRLDRDTSGLLLVAKSKEVSRAFEQDWKQTVYDRAYVALLWGRPEPPQGEYRSWLTDGEFCVLSSPTDNGGKLAVTHYRTIRFSKRYALVEFRLDTGRRNQIRVHAREMGHPVVHDPMYGYKDDVSPVNRLCLHACRLGFTHPVTGKKLDFSTPIPTEFERLVDAT